MINIMKGGMKGNRLLGYDASDYDPVMYQGHFQQFFYQLDDLNNDNRFIYKHTLIHTQPKRLSIHSNRYIYQPGILATIYLGIMK